MSGGLRSRDYRAALLPPVVFACVLATFWPALRNDFVGWDDPEVVQNNPNIRGLGAANIRWMFTTFHMGHYQPLSWLTLAVDYKLWGLAPRGYHRTNVLLHAANAVLVYLLGLVLLTHAPNQSRDRKGADSLVRESLLTPGRAGPPAADSRVYVAAALAALLFALHPLRVESVAWVTERRDVLSSFFALLTVLAYLRAQRTPGRARWLVAALLTFTLSLLSRAIGVTLPLVLLVLDVYPLRRLGGGRDRWLSRAVRGVWLEKLPFIALAAGAAVAAPLAQSEAGATSTFALHGVVGRTAQACYGLVFYVWKSCAPWRLSPIYELHVPINVLSPKYVLCALAVGISMAALVVFGRRLPALRTGACCYVIQLLPVLGFVQSGVQEVADRYSYLPGIVIAMLAAGAVRRLWCGESARGWMRVGAVVVTVAVLPILAWASWRRCGVWRDSTSLWTYAIARAPESGMAQGNYACVLVLQKRYDESLRYFRRALQIMPEHENTYQNFWNVLKFEGQDDELIESCRQAVRVKPAFKDAHYKLWDALTRRGRTDELIAAYRAAVRIDPHWADAHYNLGNAVFRKGEVDEAIAEYRAALSARPGFAQAHGALAWALLQNGDEEGAVRHNLLAIQADPKLVAARYNLAQVLIRKGQIAEAQEQLREALRINPNDAQARQALDALTAPKTSP